MQHTEYAQFVADPEPTDALEMLDKALTGLSKVMDYDALAPQALIAAETLLDVAKVALPQVQVLADR